jgi:hypothetical protein
MRLIDADALKEYATGGVTSVGLLTLAEIDNAPTIDAVPVVRCKDCKYKFSANGHNKDGCPLDGVGLMHDDDFCSCGERKRDD